MGLETYLRSNDKTLKIDDSIRLFNFEHSEEFGTTFHPRAYMTFIEKLSNHEITLREDSVLTAEQVIKLADLLENWLKLTKMSDWYLAALDDVNAPVLSDQEKYIHINSLAMLFRAYANVNGTGYVC